MAAVNKMAATDIKMASMNKMAVTIDSAREQLVRLTVWPEEVYVIDNMLAFLPFVVT